ncbi:MAG: type VI secretion system baseplate subunit TssK [Gemmataceae bacterium]
MSMHEVNWHEGMFLVPHHFQAAQRYGLRLLHEHSQLDLHYNWGLRAIDIDIDALANHRFVVRGLTARLTDGTIISVPRDGILAALDLREVLAEKNPATIALAVPAAALGRVNTAAEARRDVRYRAEAREIEDENTGEDAQEIQFRLPNLRMLSSTQEQAGYEVLPIARVEKGERAEALPQLDATYIPPVLACDAWTGLHQGVLQPIYDRIGRKVKLLSQQVVNRAITFDSRNQGDSLIFEQLRALNEAYAFLGVQTFARGIHPLDAYLELARIVGRLAIFGGTREPPEIPRYDHDDLGYCFFKLKQYLDGLGDELKEPTYKERPFVGAGLRMQVSLEPSWLEPAWQMFVGVNSQLEPADCVKLLARGLDMKIGSSETVDEIFRLGQAGLRFTYEPTPPRALPAAQGLIYFQIDRHAKPEEWANVQRSLSLAVRLNEKLIAGNIQGQKTLAVKTAGHSTTLQFTMFLVPKGQ